MNWVGGLIPLFSLIAVSFTSRIFSENTCPAASEGHFILIQIDQMGQVNCSRLAIVSQISGFPKSSQTVERISKKEGVLEAISSQQAPWLSKFVWIYMHEKYFRKGWNATNTKGCEKSIVLLMYVGNVYVCKAHSSTVTLFSILHTEGRDLMYTMQITPK